MAPREDLDAAYRNLTPMQQAVVDARVEHPNVPKTHISRDYAPKIYNEHYAEDESEHKDEFNNSHVNQLLNGNEKAIFPEIIEYRRELKENQRQEGTMTTEGDPFSADPNIDSDDSWQTWDERPNKTAAQTSASESDGGDGDAQAQQTELVSQANQAAPRLAVADSGDGVVLKLDYEYVRELLESHELPADVEHRLMGVVFSKVTA